MKVNTSTVTTTTVEIDGREFVLPVRDPWDQGIIEDTLKSEVNGDGTTSLWYIVHDLSYVVDSDDVLPGWDYMELHSQRDANALSDRLNFCDVCGVEYGERHDDWEEGEEVHPFENEWRTALEEGRAFYFERYEHGVTVYGLIGESSQVDRQWDVTPIAGIMVADDQWGENVELTQAARASLREYTDLVNGRVFCAVRADYAPDCSDYTDYEIVGGYIGADAAKDAFCDI